MVVLFFFFFPVTILSVFGHFLFVLFSNVHISVHIYIFPVLLGYVGVTSLFGFLLRIPFIFPSKYGLRSGMNDAFLGAFFYLPFSFLFFLGSGHGAQAIGWLGLRGALAIGLGWSVVRTLEGKGGNLAV